MGDKVSPKKPPQLLSLCLSSHRHALSPRSEEDHHFHPGLTCSAIFALEGGTEVKTGKYRIEAFTIGLFRWSLGFCDLSLLLS